MEVAWQSECTCPLRPGMSYRELMDEIYLADKNCCSTKNAPHKGWICEVLDKELTRARKERDQQKWFQKGKIKRLRDQGLTDNEIAEELEKPSQPRKKRKKQSTLIKKRVPVDLGSF